MSFTERVISYIKANYDIPDKMEFYIGTEEYEFKDWVDEYIEEYNNNVSSPFDDNADDNDVEAVGEEILQIMTAPYKTGNEYVINYDDFEASTKKSALQKENEDVCEYEVHTANEDGWTDYHEEDDVTDDFDVAIDWLKRSDVKWGEIRCDGKLIAWTEENPNYDPEYGGCPNIIEYADGWGRHGKIASTKKMKKSESVKKRLIALDRNGNEVPIGSEITDFRGDKAILVGITRANEFRYGGGRSGKIVYRDINSDWEQEVYDKVFDITVIDTDLEEKMGKSTKKSKSVNKMINRYKQVFVKSLEGLYRAIGMFKNEVADKDLIPEHLIEDVDDVIRERAMRDGKEVLGTNLSNDELTKSEVVTGFVPPISARNGFYSIFDLESKIKEVFAEIGIDDDRGLSFEIAQYWVDVLLDDGYSASTKKSQDIHSMIDNIRNNNNSLKKSRVDLAKYRSVGSDYPLDVARIANEMYAIYRRKHDPYSRTPYYLENAYEDWEKENYELDIRDEYDDKIYHDEIYDRLEDLILSNKKSEQDELMDIIYDLQYNDLISIAGREVYVKSTNGNDTYNGCKLWCGPDKDDESGWYFDASDFEEVISRSGSGDNIWNHSW